ncbi:phosphopantetheine-binding protein, partial [Streptomyces sp. 2MCAF27]
MSDEAMQVGAADEGQRLTGESIEQGGGGLSVADLLARALPGASAPSQATAGDDPGDEPHSDIDTDVGASVHADVDQLAEAIAATAARYLPDARMGPDTDFFDAGGTSVEAVELVAAVARESGVELALDDVFADARPRRLAERWLSATGIRTAHTPPTPVPTTPAPTARALPVNTADEDLDLVLADLARADALPWTGPPEPAQPRRILLTGATGFLGGHMLLDLLRYS